MEILRDHSLKQYNTFGVDARADYFAAFSNVDELEELMTYKPDSNLLILGGGSNLLFTQHWNGIVLKNEVSGIEELHEDNDYVYVRAGAGENWHQFVLYCINRNWCGIENLSLIPGNVGASPMQNIGAYGVELQDVFWDLEAWHIKEKKRVTFTLSDCEFGYRESVFKKKYRNQLVILNVTFRLRKKPIFHTAYGAIQQELQKMGVADLSIRDISNAVISIRSSKLPNPKAIGNAGSFFKNPSVSLQEFQRLKQLHPGIVNFPNANGTIKLAAGWLIDQCGWKGYRRGDAGCYEHQALVLVNYGSASGKEIYTLSEDILQSVKEKFQIILEREVNII